MILNNKKENMQVALFTISLLLISLEQTLMLSVLILKEKGMFLLKLLCVRWPHG